MQSKNISYLPAIDQLRGMAALLIVFYHGLSLISYQLIHQKPFWFDHWLSADSIFSAILIEGHTAVALFMVLSGFIFTIGTYKNKIDYRQFISNRLLRTYPLFLLLLFLGIASTPSSYNFSGLLKTIFFMSNTEGAITAGKFTSMFWTIAVEWQFYLLFPLLMRIANHTGIKSLIGIVLIFIALRCGLYLQGSNIRDISYSTIIGRMDQFLIGMIIGIIYIRFFKKSLTYDFLFLASTLSAFSALYWFNLNGGWPTNNYTKILWPTAEALIWGGFILGYLSFSRWITIAIGKLLSSVGLISYSIYLTHFVIIDFCIRHDFILTLFETRHLINAIASTIIIILPIVLVVSTLTYLFIEKPFLNLRRSYKKEKTPII